MGMNEAAGQNSQAEENIYNTLKDIVRLHSPEILLIQETKLEDTLLLHSSKIFWRKGPDRAVSARGASGGDCLLLGQLQI